MCLSDPWPESLLPKPYSDFSLPILDHLQKRIVANVFSRADALVFPCEEGLQYLSKDYPELVDRQVFIIPHVAPPFEKKEMHLKCRDKINIVHAGSFSRERVCVGLAVAVAALPKSSKLNFQFIGDVHPGMRAEFEKKVQ